ncbi:MAG: APC family permease [Verrucomicrobia bacterium]|nr:APC family permease [Verrucomicrobiota bacterium]
MKNQSWGGWVRSLFIGKALKISDRGLLVSLVAVLAWVGLGADGLSSACYGPEETMRALMSHPALSLFVAAGSIFTIAVICASYSQIIELFPGGGGGYLVASKLLTPSVGVVSGCALLVDYVLTIALSVAAGADALFSVLPSAWLPWKLTMTLAIGMALTLLNLRGVKESVVFCVPIFFSFLITHGFMIVYGFFAHAGNLPELVAMTSQDVIAAHQELGWWRIGAVLLTAYSLGAGSYTGIEAVSNGLSVLREPRVETGKRTMVYIGVSLAFMVGGLLFMYLLYHTVPQEGMTLNAVLFREITSTWPTWLSGGFVWGAMLSAAAILFIAAQTGFLGGPGVLSNLALDRWMPSRFASLSDRFVSQNGVVIMGASSLFLIWVSRGSVSWLVVLYAINVFVTFSLSQLGMVVHWLTERDHSPHWRKKLLINGVGFILTGTILVALSIIKFDHGGWITLLVTGALILVAFGIKHHYRRAQAQLKRLDSLIEAFELTPIDAGHLPRDPDPDAKTAVLFVNGFNGLGIHTLFAVQRMFPHVFKNFIFAEVGVVDAGNFKGVSEIGNLQTSVKRDAERYAEYMRAHGVYAESVYEIGPDVVSGAQELAGKLWRRFPNSIFFGGQLVFQKETFFTRLLHNFTVFVLQREFFKQGMPFFVLPVRV